MVVKSNTDNIISTLARLGVFKMNSRYREQYCSAVDAAHHSTRSGDSEMGVIGLDVRRCLPLLLRRSLLGFFGAYRGGKMGNACPIGGTRGGAGASSRNGQENSSSKSSPKRSASLM
jgi:hypothetical protein